MPRLALLLTLLLLCLAATEATAQQPKFDILIVGNDSRSELRETARELPIDEYSIDKPGNLAAVKKLGISTQRTVYVAVCRLGGSRNLPVTVLKGFGPVTNIDEAVSLMMADVTTRLGLTAPPPPPSGTTNEPARIARAFFQSMGRRDDFTAWGLLTEGRQNRIVQGLAKDGNLTVEQAREQLDNNRQGVLTQVFEEFRKRLPADRLAEVRYRTKTVRDNEALVEMVRDSRSFTMQMRRERGLWKVALFETAEALDKPPAPKDLAATVTSFFKAVATQEYAVAWTLLSAESQREFAAALARECKISEAEAREQFQDVRMYAQNFWNAFRESSHSVDLNAHASFTTQIIEGPRAEVEVQYQDRRFPVKMFLEGSDWKLGWKETFFPQGIR